MIKNPPNNKSPGNGANRPAAAAKPKQQKPRPPRRNGGGDQHLVAAAAAYASGQKTRAPRIVANRDQSVIEHRELVTSVSGTVAFTVAQALAINPGMAATFPWLSSQAVGWEKYKFEYLRFCYYTRTGSGVAGSVLLAPDYDAADAPPGSEAIASAYSDVAEDAPWKNIVCELNKKRLKELYIRTGPLAANLDVKTYDSGQLFLCVLDAAAPAAWGKLWVEYKVTLMSPQLPPQGGALLDSFMTQTLSGDVAGDDLFDGGVPTAGSDLGLVIVLPGTTGEQASIHFQKPGRFLYTVSIGPNALGETCELLPCSASAGSVIMSEDHAGNTTAGAMLVGAIQVNTPGSRLMVNATVTAGDVAAVLTVVQFPLTQEPFTIAP